MLLPTYFHTWGDYLPRAILVVSNFNRLKTISRFEALRVMEFNLNRRVQVWEPWISSIVIRWGRLCFPPLLKSIITYVPWWRWYYKVVCHRTLWSVRRWVIPRLWRAVIYLILGRITEICLVRLDLYRLIIIKLTCLWGITIFCTRCWKPYGTSLN